MNYETPYRSASGFYHVKVYNPNTKKRTTRSTKEKTLEAAVNKIARWKRRGNRIFTVEEAREKFLEHKRPHVSFDRLKHLRSVSKKWTKAWPGRDVDSVSRLEVGDWLNGQIDLGRTPHTINVYLKDLNCFFNWCCDHRLVQHPPTKGIKQLRAPEHNPIVIEPDEVRSMLHVASQEAPPWVWSWLAIGFSAGLRGATIRGLHRGCYKLKKDAQAWTIPGHLQKGRRRLDVPMSGLSRMAIERLQTNSRNWRLFPKRDILPYSHWWARIRDLCDLPPEVTPHAMRRTFITTLFRTTGHLKAIAKLAGSTNYNTLIEHYQCISPPEVSVILKPWDLYALDYHEYQPKIGEHEIGTKEWRAQPIQDRKNAAREAGEKIRVEYHRQRRIREATLAEAIAKNEGPQQADGLRDILQVWSGDGLEIAPAGRVHGNVIS